MICEKRCCINGDRHYGQKFANNYNLNLFYFDMISGWQTLANGTKVRRQKQWSRTSYETSYGGVQLDPNERDELAAQLAHGKVFNHFKVLT